jgi:endoglucanase
MQLISHSRHLVTSSVSVLAAMVLAACGDAIGPDMSHEASNGGGLNGGATQPTAPVPSAPSFANPLAGSSLYVASSSNALTTAAAWRTSRPADARQMEKIASQAQALWFGGWNSDIRADVNRAVATAASSSATPVLVAYNVPQRDCGSYSAGGSSSAPAYRAWIDAFAAGIGARKAVVILEPDALAGMDCLSTTDQGTRTDLLKYAIATFRGLGNTAVYLDAGHSRWQSAGTMASRLVGAGIKLANGFALNVSNFFATAEQIVYGNALSALVGGKHYVIDTSRNGLGPTADAQWCNPEGRALGERPTTATGNTLVDAFLWIKVPGDSDGSCNGNPAAGSWMPEYALGLAQRAGY